MGQLGRHGKLDVARDLIGQDTMARGDYGLSARVSSILFFLKDGGGGGRRDEDFEVKDDGGVCVCWEIHKGREKGNARRV